VPDAVANFEKVWVRDQNVGCAAFGLARLRLSAGDRQTAVATLYAVPDDSPNRNRARIAAVRALTLPAEEPPEATHLATALQRIPTIGLDRAAQARLTAAALETVLRTMTTGFDALPEGLRSESAVRDRLATLYGLLAHYGPTPQALRQSRQDRKARGLFEVAVERTQTDDTLAVSVSVLAIRRARNVRLDVWTTRGTVLTEAIPEVGPLERVSKA
jgi:thioredoxin-like negative regulator of GroEL